MVVTRSFLNIGLGEDSSIDDDVSNIGLGVARSLLLSKKELRKPSVVTRPRALSSNPSIFISTDI